MNRLFPDLFAYRQRENKDPLEDWLTECLAATLRAFPEGKLAELLCFVALASVKLWIPFVHGAQS